MKLIMVGLLVNFVAADKAPEAQDQEQRTVSATAVTEASIGGIGIVLGDFNTETGTAVVLKVLPNSVAEKIGVKEMDRVLRVNGTIFHELDDMVQAIRGNVGEIVVLTLLRSDGESELTLGAVREPLEISEER